MNKWEYSVVSVAIYDEGSGGGPQELLSIRLPDAHSKSVTNKYGVVGLLNQLGAQGWELVDVESRRFYLKRPKQTKA